MNDADKKPYLSVTQLEMFGKCGEQYRRRYMEQQRLPPGVAMTRGKAVHTAAEQNMRQKIQSHENMRASDVVAMADAAFTASIETGGIMLNSDEESRGVKVVTGEARDQVARLARLHAFAQAPDYQPVAVERTIRVELPQSKRDLLCVIDLVDTRNRVIDFKTMSKTPNRADAETSIQLTAYHVAWNAYTGAPPSELRLDATIDGANQQRREVIVTARTPDHVESLGARFAAVGQAIDVGAFPPAAVGQWFCSKKWCGYYGSCAFVRGQTTQND